MSIQKTTHPASISSLRAWGTVALLWFVGLLNYLDRVTITTMHGSLTEAIPMTEAQFGLLTTAFLVVYGALSPFAGYLADRFSRARVIVVSLFAWSLITWLTAHAKTFEQLLATRALMGISEACYIPAALAMIADFHRGPTRSLATGINVTGILVGSGLGGLGGWLAERHGWAYPFSLFGLVGIGYAVVVALLLRDAPRQGDEVGDSTVHVAPKVRLAEALISLLGRKSFLLALAFWGLLGLSAWGVVGWMPTYLKERFQLSQGEAGLSATGYLQAAALVGVLLGGVWADRWSRTHQRGRIFVPVIGLCFAAPWILLAGSTDVLPFAIAGLILYGLASAFADANMMPILCMVADRRYRATGYGLLNCCACLAGGLTIYIGGLLRDHEINVSVIFKLAAIGLVGCAALMFFVKPHPMHSDEHERG